MTSSRGFLDRFRASGTPGAAAGAGVPADRVAERDAELAGLFEQLSTTEAEADRLTREGQRRADEITAAANESARRILADARHDAESERRAEASRVAALSDAETATTLTNAETDVGRIREHARQVLPDYVEDVMGRLLAELGLPEHGEPEKQVSAPERRA